jgi:transposase InsO family protein
MRAEGLEGVRRGKKRRTTTPDEAAAERARDLVQRDFTEGCPHNTIWGASGPSTQASLLGWRAALYACPR